MEAVREKTFPDYSSTSQALQFTVKSQLYSLQHCLCHIQEPYSSPLYFSEVLTIGQNGWEVSE